MQVITWNSRRWKLTAALFAALAVGGIVGLAAEKHHMVARVDIPKIDLRAPEQAKPSAGFADVIQRDLPAVVNVSTARTVKRAAEGPNPLFMDPFFRQFFGDLPAQRPGSQREHAMGSGVIVSADGYVLTNNHVIDEAAQITVTLGDKREFKAKLVGADPRSDLAVLKVEAENLPTLTFADSSKVRIGDYALAIGDPFGIGRTVTLGIVSATGRGNLGIEDYEDFIQTDAAINPGNSGGALVNSQGDLIGINTAIISPNGGGNNGVGFAIPSNMARSVMNELVAHGKVTRARLGVMLQPLTPALAKAFGLEGPNGALVGEVEPGSPAAKAGLKSGDVIVKFNGEPIADSNQLKLKVGMLKPGGEADVVAMRNGSEHTFTVTLGEMSMTAGPVGEKGKSSSALAGVSVDALTQAVRRQLELNTGTQGVVVTAVDPASNAAEAGLRRGDVIVSVGHTPVGSLDDFQAAVNQSAKGPLLLQVIRQGNTLYLAIDSDQ
ncbi:MAG: DegQ family serine endoprotease [Bryobacteraceae bacterium]